MTILTKTQWFKRQAALVLLIMCHAVSTWAQEPPNDATREETIAFIKKNEIYLTQSSDDWLQRILINADKIYDVNYKYTSSRTSFHINEAPLRNLKAVEKWENNEGITLEFPDESVRLLWYSDPDIMPSEMKSLVMNMDIAKLEQLLSVPYVPYKDGRDGPYKDGRGTLLTSVSYSSLNIPISDAEMGERMVKAFEHLIYLSEKEDKF